MIIFLLHRVFYSLCKKIASRGKNYNPEARETFLSLPRRVIAQCLNADADSSRLVCVALKVEYREPKFFSPSFVVYLVCC